MSPISIPGKVTLQKEFIAQSFMYLNPDTFGLWSPGQISTELWLDAADVSTITASGGAVSQWDDKSGNNYHVSQATAADRPTVSTDAGNASLLFDGTSDYLSHLVSGTIAYPTAAFIVCRNTNTNNDGHALSINDSNSSSRYLTLTQRNSSGQAILYNVRNTASSVISSSSTFNTEIIGGVSNASNDNELFSNGTSVGTNTTNFPTPSYNNITIGRLRYQLTAQHFSGHIHEVIWITQTLTTTTRQKIEGYLAHKWGLTSNLPADHPYKTAIPVP